MKGISCANQKMFFPLIFFTIAVSLFLMGTVYYFGVYPSYATSHLIKKIENEPSVLSAKILYLDGVPPHIKHAIEILFNDGGRLEVNEINHRGGGSIRIFYVDDYACGIMKRNRVGIAVKSGFEVWSAIIGVQLKTVFDIIQNYQIIRANMESWPDLYNYRNDNENISDAVNKLFAENLVSNNFITVVGQEYFFYKYQHLRKERDEGIILGKMEEMQ